MHFHPLALVLSFCVGMLYMICYTPRPQMIIKFPSPGGHSDLYHTEGGACYRVKSKQVACPKDGANVVAQPVTDQDVAHPAMKYFTAA